ncbi:unnamed protein product [Parascedosporium putredinis]|uniref:Metallo-beta-lactamase domain-containing protein n=1 Tax=Parascedosporium putredinis TaxID=1442378 RepID=A0A9P1H5K6_9PEZI|nr:unnamed protein product [Parascedosporium putredinis]CAI7997016.1 unnamed protein product [Parascedosporium putredinis]
MCTDAVPPPQHEIPSGDTIKVSMINTVNFGPGNVAKLMGPPVPYVEHFGTSPALSFLLEHSSGRKLVFDLGVRKDYLNLAPKISNYIPTTPYKFDVTQDVIEVLEENGIKGEDIEAVIWSHYHWDHIGNPSLGRNLREINCTGEGSLKIGKFDAFDYFGDGSFYLLDTPGHAVGHLNGLARTTKNPDTFVWLGGDIAHYGGEYRPSQYLPIPDGAIEPHTGFVPKHKPFCPGEEFAKLQESRGRKPNEPLYEVRFGTDPVLAMKTIGHMQEFDVNDSIFVIIAHDRDVRDLVPHFPAQLNDWKEQGYAKKLKWAFLRDLDAYWKSVNAI